MIVRRITIQQLMERQDLVGGFIESTEEMVSCRGPIASGELIDRSFVFKTDLKKTEGYSLVDAIWEPWNHEHTVVISPVTPSLWEHDDGHIDYSDGLLLSAHIYPKGVAYRERSLL